MALFVSTTTDKDNKDAQEHLARLWKRAVNAGLEPMRLENVFAGYNLADVQVTPWDSHPSAFGHQLLANKFYEFLLQREPQLFVKKVKTEIPEGTGATIIEER
jgi:hypothetical protein